MADGALGPYAMTSSHSHSVIKCIILQRNSYFRTIGHERQGTVKKRNELVLLEMLCTSSKEPLRLQIINVGMQDGSIANSQRSIHATLGIKGTYTL